jgi:putative transposase
MPHQQRTIQHYNDPGHVHFLTFSCYQKLPLLNRNRTRHWLIEALINAKQKHKYGLWAYVIMPEHVHLIVLPLSPQYDISLFLKSLKQAVSRKAKHYLQLHDTTWLERLTVRRGSKFVFRFWQSGPGYDRNIHSEAELLEKTNYIHNNPVKRGLVKTAEEWEWSSAPWYLGKEHVHLPMDDHTFSERHTIPFQSAVDKLVYPCGENY